jgi:dihydrolipoamide dehydrogenase
MSKSYDVIVIGAGPGGYVAAIRAAQLGLKTAVVEKDQPGGVCLNWGCIPSKNLIHQAEVFHSLKEMEAVGVSIDRSSLDYTRVHANSRQVVKTLTNGVSGLLKKNKVDLIKGTAIVSGKGEVTVDGKDKLQAKNILLATGSRPMQVPGFECDEKQVLSSNGILAMTELPKSIVILGAGAIGCEFAYVMNSFGVQVTLVEALDHILPTEDYETCGVLESCLVRDGIDVRVKTRALELNKTAETVSVTLQDSNGETEQIEAEKVLVVFGRTPNTEGLGLKEMGVEMDDRGYVAIGDYCQTAAVGIYAIGDITLTPALAHVASKEGEIAVEYMAGHSPDHVVDKAVDPAKVPSAIYCEPQVAGFGLREDTAKAEGIAVKKSVFHYPGAGKTIAIGKPDGLVKVLCDPKTNELLGAHIVGHNATELIHELLLAHTSELLPEDISNTIHAHPTISETIMEVMRGVDGQPIHA